MLINEVCKECSLTRKAISYYEKQGLLNPQIGPNGYRIYTDKDVSILKEISVLKSLGLTISEVKKVISSSNKSQALAQYSYLHELRKLRIIEQQKGINLLIENYNIEIGKEFVDAKLSRAFTIKEKLFLAFPGAFGMYLSFHFGPFLEVKIDRPEQEEAYHKIVEFLDHIIIPKELEQYLESIIPIMEQNDLEKIAIDFQNTVENFDSYLKTKKQHLEEYISFRGSEAYKDTLAYQLQQLLKAFQKSSGYYEIFIKNLCVLSAAYRKYLEKLQKANRALIEQYPQAEKL